MEDSWDYINWVLGYHRDLKGGTISKHMVDGLEGKILKGVDTKLTHNSQDYNNPMCQGSWKNLIHKAFLIEEFIFVLD